MSSLALAPEPTSEPGPRADGQLAMGWLVSVNTNAGGVPKHPRPTGAYLGKSGLDGDSQGHEKHRKPERALSVQSLEMITRLRREGFRGLTPGAMAENLTIVGIDLTQLAAGARLVFEGGPVVEVSGQRKPCFQLNPMGEGLDQAAVGRCGVMCRVVSDGHLRPGMAFCVEPPQAG